MTHPSPRSNLYSSPSPHPRPQPNTRKVWEQPSPIRIVTPPFTIATVPYPSTPSRYAGGCTHVNRDLIWTRCLWQEKP